MTTDGLRRLRVVFKFGLLVCLPVAGYLWAQTGTSALTLTATAVCVVLALGAEGLASGAESRLSKLRAVAEEEDRTFEAEASTRDEKIRQMDRIVETLSNQNHDLRGKLISLHGEVHRTQDELNEHPAKDGKTEPGEGESGGAVTDFSTLRNRR